MSNHRRTPQDATSTGHGEKLSRKMESAIAALLGQSSILKAAKKAGIGEKTLRNWIKIPAFSDAYTDARRQLMAGAVGKLQKSCSGAIGVLVKVAKDPTQPASARVTAAKAIVDAAFRGTELHEVTKRVEALEDTTGERNV